ncbi:hypothetical protein F5Y17DRAFT_474121 [Xylariaceae sp. FL0594]|nr:hypothetical protein F5Y17DRAFT_474121 [Xylariaceae sp. FL0594]
MDSSNGIASLENSASSLNLPRKTFTSSSYFRLVCTRTSMTWVHVIVSRSQVAGYEYMLGTVAEVRYRNWDTFKNYFAPEDKHIAIEVLTADEDLDAEIAEEQLRRCAHANREETDKFLRQTSAEDRRPESARMERIRINSAAILDILFLSSDDICHIEARELAKKDRYIFSRDRPGVERDATSQDLFPEDRMLLPPRLFAYSLRNRKFFQADIRNIKETPSIAHYEDFERPRMHGPHLDASHFRQVETMTR